MIKTTLAKRYCEVSIREEGDLVDEFAVVARQLNELIDREWIPHD